MAFISCPECKKQISNHAIACPQCGFPIQSGNRPRTLRQEIADVGKAGFWLWLFISLPGLTIPAIIAKVILPGSAGATEIQAIGELLVLTMPLTLAITLFSLAILRDWIGYLDTNYFLALALFLLFPLLATTVTSNFFGLDAGVSISEALTKTHGGGKFALFMFLGNILIAYAKAYGLWNFISSLAVGGFLAWAWSQKILPHLLRENTLEERANLSIPLYKWLIPIAFVLFLAFIPLAFEFMIRSVKRSAIDKIEADKVSTVVNKMVKTLGGSEKISSIQNQVMTWDSQFITEQGDSKITVPGITTNIFMRPNKLKVECKDLNGSVWYKSVFDGNKGWVYTVTSDGVSNVRDMTLAEIQEQTTLAEIWVDGWYNYSQKGFKLEILPNATINDKVYYVVQQTDRFKNVSKNYCDPQTGLIEGIQGSQIDPITGNKMPYVTAFSDYRRYDGYMIAEKIKLFDGTGKLLLVEQTLKEVKHNMSIADIEFRKPR